MYDRGKDSYDNLDMLPVMTPVQGRAACAAPGDPQGSPELPGAPWGSLGFPGAPWGSLGFPKGPKIQK